MTEVVSKITWSGGTITPGEFMDFPSRSAAARGRRLAGVPVDADLRGRRGRPLDRHPRGGRRGARAPGADADPAPGRGGGRPATTAPAGEEAAAGEDSDNSSNGLAVAALIVGILGLAVGGFALVQGRSASAAAASKD